MNNARKSQQEFTPIGSTQAKFFLDGPHSRRKELLFLFYVIREFVKGFRVLHFTGPSVTVFGSARFEESHPFYIQARQIGQEIAKLGFTVMTGGGPGIMEAANRGAKDAGGISIGCNIILPKEQYPNKYLDKWVDIEYFFIRKVLLTKYSYAFVVMPGGYGTMDEFFEAIELIQTGKTARFPVILFGVEYHKELYAHFQKMKDEKTIEEKDLELFLFTDSVEDAIRYIEMNAIENFGLKKHRKIKPSKLLGEHGFKFPFSSKH